MCVIVAMSITGCRTTWYELEMHPDGDAMQRKVSMWLYTYPDGVQTYDDFSAYKLGYVSQLYGAEMPANLAQRHEFEGEFQTRLPADVTHGGWLLHQASPMGSISAYVEHVAGSSRISWDLATRELSLNRLVDVWLAWLDSEFSGDARYPRFREFVDVVIRDDLWNVSLYLWAFDTAGLVMSDDAGDEAEERLSWNILFRVGIYLAERDYFDPEEIPKLISGSYAATDDFGPEYTLPIIMRGLATKLGTPADEPLPWPLGEFAKNPDAYAESFDQFVTESDTMRAMVDAWKQEYSDSLSPAESARRKQFDAYTDQLFGVPDAVNVEVAEDLLEVDVPPRNYPALGNDESVMTQLSNKAFLGDWDLDLFSTDGADLLQVILHLPREPMLTNGTWEADNKVRWRDDISPGGEFGNRLPDVFYAFWVEPDVEFQEERFGRAVLGDEELVGYVGWRMTLSPELQEEWDEFLSGLEPGPDLIRRLQEFCFSTELSECRAKPEPAAPGYEKLEGGGHLRVIPVRSDIGEDVLWELVAALMPELEPESSDE